MCTITHISVFILNKYIRSRCVLCVCGGGGGGSCMFINISVCVHQKRDYLYTGAYL